MMLCVERDLNFGPVVGYSTMILLHLMRFFLPHKSITDLEHPPYSPDLVLNEFWLFPEIKSALKG
jgi:hypothetical protein